MNENYVVISTDCHAGGSMDQYREFLDPKWLAEYEAWRGAYKNPFRDLSGSKRYRNWDSDARLSEMEDDGIVAEVAFPNTVPPFFPSASFMARAPKDRDEYDRRWAGLQAHNRWVRDHFVAAAPERRAGMAQILLNDVDDAVDDDPLGGRERSARRHPAPRRAARLASPAAVREPTCTNRSGMPSRRPACPSTITRAAPRPTTASTPQVASCGCSRPASTRTARSGR